MLTLLIGGARSGKSTLAVELARSGGSRVTFVATAEALDDDMKVRIDRHRDERPSDWTTLEEPVELRHTIETALSPTVVVDCLTLWVSNMFEHGFDELAIIEAATNTARAAQMSAARVIVVTNEVGSGIIPADAATRHFRDTLGRVNHIFSRSADRALLVVAGRVLNLLEPSEIRPISENPTS